MEDLDSLVRCLGRSADLVAGPRDEWPTDISHSGEAGVEPLWIWTASWEKAVDGWERQWTWASAWQEMAAAHGFISPPRMRVSVSATGNRVVTATWASSVRPLSDEDLVQGPGCYRAWYKADEPFAMPRSEEYAASASAESLFSAW